MDNPSRPRTASEVLQELGRRHQEYLNNLEALVKIVQSHPEWQEQEPQLKILLEAVRRDK